MLSGLDADRQSDHALLGFQGLLRKEFQSWWGTRRWIIQAVIWTLGLNGLLFVALFVLPGIMAAQGEELGDPLVVGGQMFFALGMMAVSVGVIVLTQGEIIDERESGTAAWILSKPVSRSAFVLAKLAANAVSILSLMLLAPAAVAFVQLSIASKGRLGMAGFISALSLTGLHVLFYLSLTILLGILLKSRGAILGASLGLLLGGMLLRSLPIISMLMPWILPDIAGAVVADPSLLLPAPVIMTGVWILIFIAVGFIAFEKVEL